MSACGLQSTSFHTPKSVDVMNRVETERFLPIASSENGSDTIAIYLLQGFDVLNDDIFLFAQPQ